MAPLAVKQKFPSSCLAAKYGQNFYIFPNILRHFSAYLCELYDLNRMPLSHLLIENFLDKSLMYLNLILFALE